MAKLPYPHAVPVGGTLVNRQQGVEMKKRLVTLAIMLVAALLLTSGGRTLRAAGHETDYTITYICTCSPGCYGMIVGQWHVDCDGNWSGWGDAPYADPYCTSTEMDIGAFCGPDYP
jgi:hypothetical protein